MPTASSSVVSATRIEGWNRLAIMAGIVVFLSLIAFSISAYMSWVAFTSSKIAGCGSGGVFDCSHVLTSKWSKAFGLPVAAWAAGLYGTMIAMFLATWSTATSRVAEQRNHTVWVLMTVASISAGGAALWFTGLQVFVLEHLCPWCLGAHACGIVLCGMMLAGSPISWRAKLQSASVALVGCVALMSAQILAPAPQTYEIQDLAPAQSPDSPSGKPEVFDSELFDAPSNDAAEVFSAPDSASLNSLPAWLSDIQTVAAVVWQPSYFLTTQTAAGSTPATQSGEKPAPANEPAKEEQRLIQLGSANLSLDAKKWPIIGSPTAKYIFVEMFDYTCPHCRNSQVAIKGVRQKYKDDLAIVALPVPLSKACNDTVTQEHPDHREACEIARIAVAVWRVKPDAFASFHEWLFDQSGKLTGAIAKTKAEELVGAKLTEELAQPAAGKYIGKHVELYRRVGSGPVPKMIFPRTSVVGEMTSTSVLSDLIEKHAAQ